MLKRILLLSLIFCFMPLCYGIEGNNSFFNLNSIVDAVLTVIDEKEDNTSLLFLEQQKTYSEITQKFLQGNVVVAYDEYLEFLDKIDNDMVFLSLGEEFYKLGLFSLGDEALVRIEHKNEIKKQIEDLKKSYEPKMKFSVEEEKQFAKSYVEINYENYAQEASFELGKNKEILSKSDYANYLMAQAQVQLKQYHQARNFIDKAISINPHNSNYLLYKVKILSLEEKYKDGLKLIDKLKKSKEITNELLMEYRLEEENLKSIIAKDETEKKLHELMGYYLEGDSYKAIKECEDIVGTDKDNYKILTFLAKNYIRVGDIDSASKNIELSYGINKKYPETLEVLGDISFINFDYKKALSYYLAANKKIKSPELYGKIALASFLSGDKKKVDKYSALLNKSGRESFYEFYDISETIALYVKNLSNDVNLSKEFLKKSIFINPLFKEAWLSFAQNQIEEKHYKMAENILVGVGAQRNPNYKFYYVNAILLNKLNKKQDAILNLEKSIGANPYFEPAKNLKSAIEADL